MITLALLTGIAALTYLVYKITKPYTFYEEQDKESPTQLKRCNDNQRLTPNV